MALSRDEEDQLKGQLFLDRLFGAIFVGGIVIWGIGKLLGAW